jgi:hypothetical protein
MIMRSPDYNSTPSEGYWSEYSNSSESSMERHKDPKQSRRTTARIVEESYMKSPSANQPEEGEEFVQETLEAALVAAHAYLLTTQPNLETRGNTCIKPQYEDKLRGNLSEKKSTHRSERQKEEVKRKSFAERN